METRIVVVEDDYQDATWIADELRSHLNALVEIIPCERDFVTRLPELAHERPSIIIFDVMLRWATSSEALEQEMEQGKVPQDVIDEGFLRAGLRCLKRMQMREDTKDIPYLVYTGLKTNNFSEEVVHINDIITKSEDIRPLIVATRKKLGWH